MIYDYPTIIVDGFFKDPLAIREFAQTFEYNPSPDGIFSGIRTRSLHTTHLNFFRGVCNKILNCYSILYTGYTASMHFHLTGKEFGDSGWVHQDSGELASIIYLNPETPDINTGTNIFKLKNLNYAHNTSVSEMRSSFKNSLDNEIIKKQHNSNYINTINIGNVFNRMTSYDAKSNHAGAGYHMNETDQPRLTLLTFFHEIATDNRRSILNNVERNSDL